MSTRFTEDHEWITVDGDVATVGITDYAQSQLGDVVFVELPEVGRKLKKGDEAAVVESVKAASEVYAPLDGEVVEANTSLADEPRHRQRGPGRGGVVRQDPAFGQGAARQPDGRGGLQGARRGALIS